MCILNQALRAVADRDFINGSLWHPKNRVDCIKPYFIVKNTVFRILKKISEGLVLGAFFYGYCLTQVAGGYFADKTRLGSFIILKCCVAF